MIELARLVKTTQLLYNALALDVNRLAQVYFNAISLVRLRDEKGIAGPDMSTLPLLFARAAEKFATQPALIEPVEGSNEMLSLSYQELQEHVHQFAGYLQQQGLSQGQRIMIWSPSRANWLISYFASLLLGLVIVPLDVNTREDFILRLVDITETTHLITTHKLYSNLQHSSLAFIDIDSLPSAPLDMTQLPALVETDLAQLVFTSGTTGQPKGVMLSHRNIVSNALGSIDAVNIKGDDRALSILPLSHMFELTIDVAILHIGASIVYARTLSPDTLFRLLATQKITCMVLVPQALQLFMNGVEREVRQQNKEKQWDILHAIAWRVPFKYRARLFKQVHARFGGHFRFFVCGGAYMQPQLGRFWEEMGFRTLQGYGATECAPVISVNPPNDHTFGSVGQPLKGVELRIADDGEIQVHGPNVALGYWQDPELTNRTFQDGWYATGDLGYLDRHHNLYLKGRKKNLIVLPNGMNVYPEDVENVLQSQEVVKDAVVFGLNERNRGTAVHAVLLLEDSSQAKTVVKQANKLLAPHQQIKSYTLWSEKDFPRTHTLKVKRQEVLDKLDKLRSAQRV